MNISDNNGLVTTTIVPINETYHLVTRTTLTHIGIDGFLVNLFMFLTSLSGGTLITVWLTNVQHRNNKEMTLVNYEFQWILVIITAFLFIMAIVMKIIELYAMKIVFKNKVDLSDFKNKDATSKNTGRAAEKYGE